jgi:hypothetical protein
MSDFLGITEGDIRAAEAETAQKLERAADREADLSSYLIPGIQRYDN